MSAGVEPGKAAAQNLNEEVSAFEIGPVDIGNFDFSPSRWSDVRRNIKHVVVVEIQTGDRNIRFGVAWLLFNRNCAAVFVQLDHAILFRGAYDVSKNCGSALSG